MSIFLDMGATGNAAAKARKAADDVSRDASTVGIFCLSYFICVATFSVCSTMTNGASFADVVASLAAELVMRHAVCYRHVHISVGDTGIVRNDKNRYATASKDGSVEVVIEHGVFSRWKRKQRRLLTQLFAGMKGMFLKIIVLTVLKLEDGMMDAGGGVLVGAAMRRNC